MNTLTLALAFKPPSVPLFLAEDDLCQSLPVTLQPSRSIIAPTEHFVKVQDLEYRVGQNRRHLEQLRHVVLESSGKRRQQQGREFVLRGIRSRLVPFWVHFISSTHDCIDLGEPVLLQERLHVLGQKPIMS